MIADVREVDYASLEAPYWLHLSPVCKSFSKAKVKGEELQFDIECAEACVRAIKALRSPYISVENVEAYEGSKSFNIIVRCLMDEGYGLAWWVLNAADYGVPQRRKRLILVASRIGRIVRPEATHQERLPHESQMSLFDGHVLPKWISWYEATKGIGLTKSKSYPTIDKKLPKPLLPYTLLTQQSFKRDVVDHTFKDNPSFTVLASPRGNISWRIWDGKHYYKITPQWVARVQSFPKCYILPKDRDLGFTVMGNAVPPLLMQCVIEAQRGE